MRVLHLLSLSTLGVALSACTLGPNYHGPTVTPPTQGRFVRASGPALASTPQLAQWWAQLGDPVLDALEARALAGNPDLAAAVARVAEARASLSQQKAAQLPSAGVMGAYLHADLPGTSLGGSSSDSGSGNTALNFYNAALDASWEADLFGGQRRGVEAARDDAEASAAKVADGQVSLTASVAQSYVALRDRQSRLALAQAMLVREQAMLALVRQKVSAGAASMIDQERQQAATDAAEASLAPLIAQRDSYLNALAVLTGAAPGALDAMLQASAPVPLPPAQVALGDPAGLIQRRPDIRAAERQLAAATARIGVAKAARFPTLKFTGFLGLGGAQLSDVFDPTSLATIAAPQLSWNFLDFGRTAAKVRQSKAARDEAEAQYRAAVLAGLKDAEDALSRYGAARAQFASAAKADATSQRSLALIGQRYAAGAATRIDLLDAQGQSLSAHASLAQARAEMTASYIAVNKALGLGWQ